MATFRQGPTLRGPRMRGVWKNRDFRQISRIISKMIRDRAIELWNSIRKLYVIYRMVPFPVTLKSGLGVIQGYHFKWPWVTWQRSIARPLCDSWASWICRLCVQWLNGGVDVCGQLSLWRQLGVDHRRTVQYWRPPTTRPPTLLTRPSVPSSMQSSTSILSVSSLHYHSP